MFVIAIFLHSFFFHSVGLPMQHIWMLRTKNVRCKHPYTNMPPEISPKTTFTFDDSPMAGINSCRWIGEVFAFHLPSLRWANWNCFLGLDFWIFRHRIRFIHHLVNVHVCKFARLYCVYHFVSMFSYSRYKITRFLCWLFLSLPLSHIDMH